MKKRHYLDITVLVLVFIGGYFAVTNAVALGDWWYFRSYSPSDKIAQLAEDAGMNEEGKKLFYRLDPQLVNKRTLVQQCGEGSIGCTFGKNIYILDDANQKEYNRSVVTAAHEMLHVAYSRLSKNEVENIKTDLDLQFGISSSRLLDKFNEFGPQDFYNEAHSYIGSEEKRLTSKLDEHYSKYFEDREKLINVLKFSEDK